MTKENDCPASAALSCPANERDAVSRVAECMKDGELGLIGSIYSSLDQLKNGLETWKVVVAPMFEKNEFASTWLLYCDSIMNKEKHIRLLVHSFGPYVQVLNAETIKEAKPAPAYAHQIMPGKVHFGV